ncbi:MAG: 50S ribosomal protein L29 [Candidatus Woesearchaeota archaeon]
MKVKELHTLSEGELKDKLDEAKKELMKQNAQIATGTTPKSPGQVKQLKKTIARINTLLHSKTKGTKV